MLIIFSKGQGKMHWVHIV